MRRRTPVPAAGPLVVCVDVGSTFTKATLVDTAAGDLLAAASTPTTLGTDVLDGLEACRDELTAHDDRARDAETLVCSSAGGGLRIAVVGNEELVTAEAGRRVALSSGGRVVHVAAGGLDRDRVAALESAGPDVVLLVGGTDGGNAEVIVGAAEALAARRWARPVVAAGNTDAREEVAARLDAAGTPYVLADNVVPRIGVLAPDSARAAVRAMFLEHVIGGKELSASAEFAALVRGATPDVVLDAVELLARGLDEERPGVGDVVVVDVGGATTDVYSVVEVDPEDSGLSREVVATLPASRTVEGDLGMRWSAPSTVPEGVVAGLLDPADATSLEIAAAVRRTDPAFLPDGADEGRVDALLARAATGVALRRHAGRSQVTWTGSDGSGAAGRVVERSGKDLREVALLVGSGGALRASPADDAVALLRGVVGEVSGGWQLPTAPRVVVDEDYVLGAAGLLARRHPEAAYRLLGRIR